MGRWPLTCSSSKNGASVTSDARPLMRRVSPRPGTKKFRPTNGFSRMLRYPSIRRLPGRSASAIVASSMTWTRLPGGSPLGETSHRPLASEVPIRQKGEAASQCTSSGCRVRRSLLAARKLGSPNMAVSWSASRTVVHVMATMLSTRPGRRTVHFGDAPPMRSVVTT